MIEDDQNKLPFCDSKMFDFEASSSIELAEESMIKCRYMSEY